MTRNTVTIRMPDDGNEPREFHLSPDKAERFAARIRSEGGTAVVGPYTPGPELLAMLASCGVDPRAVR